MCSTASALLAPLWWRHRRGLLLLAGYLAALSAAANLLPDDQRRHVPPAVSLFVLAMLYLAAVCAGPEAEVAAARSTLPRHLLLLPVRSWELALWPMLAAAAAGAALWLLLRAAILAPPGEAGPAWPAALLAALLTWLQALCWLPAPLPYARVAAAALLLPALPAAGFWLAARGVPDAALAAGFAAATLLAVPAAVWGVHSARHDEPSLLRLPPLRRRGGEAAPFPHPAAAQAWLEWRRSGFVLPAATAAVCLLLSLPLFWARELLPLELNPPRSPLGELELNLWVRLQQSAPLLPVLLAALVGCGRRGAERRSGDPGLPPFAAALPLTAAACVGAKLRTAAVSSCSAWAILAVCFTAWLLLPGRDGARTAPLLVLLAGHASPRTLPLVALCFGVLLLWSWKNQVQGLWADLSGRPALVYGAPLVAHGALLWLFVAWAHGALLAAGPGGRPLLPPSLPWLLGAALGAKLALAAGLGIVLRRRGLVSPRALAVGALAWAAAALGLWSAACWIGELPPAGLDALIVGDWIPLYGPGVPAELRSPASLAAIVVLFVPAARLLAAPLALECNRVRG